MNELIPIIRKEGKSLVSANELYLFLGYYKSNWAQWYRKNITENEFAIENEDWCSALLLGKSTTESQDFALTIEFAKKLSMLARTEKGEQARNYFIACEAKSRQVVLPGSYSEALYELAGIVKEKERLQEQNQLMAPKAEFFDAVTQSTDTFEMSEVAKILNMGFGRNTLFYNLRKLDVLRSNNEPYQQYVDNGWFKLVELKYSKGNGQTGIEHKTVVFQKGIDGIRKMFAKKQTEIKLSL